MKKIIKNIIFLYVISLQTFIFSMKMVEVPREELNNIEKLFGMQQTAGDEKNVLVREGYLVYLFNTHTKDINGVRTEEIPASENKAKKRLLTYTVTYPEKKLKSDKSSKKIIKINPTHLANLERFLQVPETKITVDTIGKIEKDYAKQLVDLVEQNKDIEIATDPLDNKKIASKKTLLGPTLYKYYQIGQRSLTSVMYIARWDGK